LTVMVLTAKLDIGNEKKNTHKNIKRAILR